MAIPLSDFYAFSSATGSPVPEDEETRARMAPQVAEWRRNQLKAPEQKSDFLSTLGTGALIAGLGTAAVLGARALRRPQAVAQATVRDVTPDVEQTVRRAATYRPEPQTARPPRGTPAPSVEVTPPPSRVSQPAPRAPGYTSQVDLYKLLETERPQGVVVTDISSLVRPKPEVRTETRLLPAAAAKPNAMNFIGQYFQQKGTAAGTLTDFQQSLSNLMADQAINAVDAAEDQMTGRVKQQLQRNEDLDMSQVDLMEEVADYNYQQAMEQPEPDRPTGQAFRAALAQHGYSLQGDPQNNELYLLTDSGREIYLKHPFSLHPKESIRRTAQEQELLGRKLFAKTGFTLEQAEEEQLVRHQALLQEAEKYWAEKEQPEPDAAINQVAAQLPDGLPVDQAESGSESGAQRFLQRQREEIASELGEQNLPVTSGRIEQELANRFGKEAWTYGPKQTKRRQALELYAQTGDPKLLENIRPQTIQFGSIGELPVSEFKKEVVMPETAVRAEERYQEQVGKAKDWLGDIRVEIAPQLNKLQQEEAILAEQHNMLMYALNKKPDAQIAQQFGAINKQLKENRRQQEYLNRRLEGATASTESRLAGIQKQLPTTLADWSGEGMVVKPKLTSAPEFEYEGDVLSTVEGLGVRQATPTEQELEYVPGGLLSGGRAKSLLNTAMVDEDTGELLEVRPASRTSLRGTGSMEQFSGDILSSEGIYGIERAPYGAGAMSKQQPGTLVPEANIPPSASPSAYRLPAGSRAQGKQAINVVVAGGREYENYPELSQKLDQIISQLNIPDESGNKMKVNIISGGARGADTLAEKYAQERGMGLQVFKADWEGQGLSAGTNRNRQMAEAGDVLVAFPGGTGTENMVQQMTQDFGKPAYRASNIQEPTEAGRRSVLMSEAVRKGLFTPPPMQGPRESADKQPGYFHLYPQEGPKNMPAEHQLRFAPDIVPDVARARVSAADVAANQLEQYMGRRYAAQQGQIDLSSLKPQTVTQAELFNTSEYINKQPSVTKQKLTPYPSSPAKQTTQTLENPGYARYSPQGYEVSSRGDKRYSAMYATLPTGQTIEQAYQSAKGTGKGQPAKDPNFDYWGTYKGLWNQYFDANPEALTEIARLSKGRTLTDQFANTANNQARAIHEILVERGLRQNTQTLGNTQSIYDLPMNFAYRGQALPDTPPTTFEAIQAGLRTSTLRKPGQVPSRVQPGTRITAVGPQGQRQLLEVTGRRMVGPEMAQELSQVERWTPQFLENYIKGYGGGQLEQLTYRMI